MTDISKQPAEVLPADMLAGKNALISGGTSGINLGIAKAFASLGANVAVFGRKAEKAEAAAAEIAACGPGKAMGLAADVRDPEAVGSVITDVTAALGKLDIVIAGAAGNFPAPAVAISPNGFKSVVDIDLLGTFNVFHLAFQHLNTAGGGASLIAITAPQAEAPTPMQAHVCAAKAGINMLVKCLAMEWGAAGIRVNAISPGPIAGTEGMARLAPTPQIEAAIKKALPLGRYGEAHEIAAVAAFLSSPLASYITGSILACDGGMVLKGAALMDAMGG